MRLELAAYLPPHLARQNFSGKALTWIGFWLAYQTKPSTTVSLITAKLTASLLSGQKVNNSN
jgi:hypothetical protein